MMFPLFFGLLLFVGASVSQEENPCANTEGNIHVCLDEKTVAVCVNGNVRSKDTCRSQRPNCVEGSCEKHQGFKCKKGMKGYFPDPWKCQTYHFCLDEAKETKTCEGSQVYNPHKFVCTRPGAQNPCHTFNCRRKNGVSIPYPGDQRIYATCSDGSVVDVFACPEGQMFDEKAGSCGNDCVSDGLIPVQGSCNKYYECTRVRGGSFKKAEKECLSGAWFNPTISGCEADVQNKCKTSSSSMTTTPSPSGTGVTPSSTTTSGPTSSSPTSSSPTSSSPTSSSPTLSSSSSSTTTTIPSKKQ